MTTEIKILDIQEKITREGKPYKVVWAKVTIDGHEFVKKFYLFT